MRRKTKDTHGSDGRFTGSKSLNLGKNPSTAQSPRISILVDNGESTAQGNLTLDENFMRVYRGLNQPPKKYGYPPVSAVLETPEPLGIHWTTNQTAAEFFAAELDGAGLGQERHHDYGVVLEAMVHINNIVQENTDEWRFLSDTVGVMAHDENEFEAEVTVRPGAEVHIVAQYMVGEGRRGSRDRVVSNRIDFPQSLPRKV